MVKFVGGTALIFSQVFLRALGKKLRKRGKIGRLRDFFKFNYSRIRKIVNLIRGVSGALIFYVAILRLFINKKKQIGGPILKPSIKIIFFKAILKILHKKVFL